MSPYYYTTAALPTIRLGEKILMGEDQFLEFAEDTLKAGDYQILLKSRLGSTEPTGFVFADRILAWETELRLELAKARLQKLQHDSPCLPESNGRDVLLEKARTAIAMDSPLEAECFLHQLRWNFIEEMGVSHFFDLEALVVYYFKLQIALRQEKFQKELGQEVFAKTYEAVTESFTINTL